LQNLNSKDYVIYYFKDDKVNETPVKEIIIQCLPAKATAKWFVDAQTGMLAKTISRQSGQNGPADVESFFSDYRDVDGVKFAFKTIQHADGKKQMEMDITSIKVNSGVKEELFKKP